MSGELATPEELAARKRLAAAKADAGLTPFERLKARFDRIGDDDLAARIEAHPDREIWLELWQRIKGAGKEALADAEKDAPKVVADVVKELVE